FLTANSMRFFSGGWLPVLIGAGLFTIMATWMRGSQILFDKARKESVLLTDLVEMLKSRPPHRVAGTAIFLTSDAEAAPVALMHYLKHNKVLHEKNIILSVKNLNVPRVPESERVTIEKLD